MLQVVAYGESRRDQWIVPLVVGPVPAIHGVARPDRSVQRADPQIRRGRHLGRGLVVRAQEIVDQVPAVASRCRSLGSRWGQPRGTER